MLRAPARIEPLVGEGAASVASLEELYAAHFSFAWRMLRRLGVHAENVSDAAQDVFLVVGRRLSDLRSPALARAWIYGIVVRTAYAYRRAQLRFPRAESGPDDLLDTRAGGPEAALAHAEEVELLDRLLSTLHPDKREVLVLVELEELSVREVAELTGLNINTVYTRLRAARILFNEAVARHRARNRSRR